MNKILLFLVCLFCTAIVHAQRTYYWIGKAGDSINVVSKWNTSVSGSGTSRPNNTDSTDVLIFDGTNLPSTGLAITSTASINCGQLKIVNNAIIQLNRSLTTGGTTTVRIAGDGTPNTEDFLIEAGSSLTLANGPGSVILNMGNITNSGRVSGNLSMITGLQAGIRNTTFFAGTLIFTAGSTFSTNITSSSALLNWVI